MLSPHSLASQNARQKDRHREEKVWGWPACQLLSWEPLAQAPG